MTNDFFTVCFPYGAESCDLISLSTGTQNQLINCISTRCLSNVFIDSVGRKKDLRLKYNHFRQNHRLKCCGHSRKRLHLLAPPEMLPLSSCWRRIASSWHFLSRALNYLAEKLTAAGRSYSAYQIDDSHTVPVSRLSHVYSHLWDCMII